MEIMIVDGVKAYEAIFKAVSKRIGYEMTVTITAMDENCGDTSDPMATIREFLVPVTAMFGDVAVKRMITESLDGLFTDTYAKDIMAQIMPKGEN